jgi:hypothetical protein
MWKGSDGAVGESILADIVDSWLPRLVVYEPDSHSSLGSCVTVLAVNSGWMAPGAGSSPAASRTG